MAFIRNVLQHHLALIEDFAVGKSNDGIAQFVQVRGAGLIVFDLLGVGIAIDFDAEFGFVAIEVDDEPIDGVLSSEFEAIQLAVAQARPEFLLGGSLRVAQFARGLQQFGRCARVWVVDVVESGLVFMLAPELRPKSWTQKPRFLNNIRGGLLGQPVGLKLSGRQIA